MRLKKSTRVSIEQVRTTRKGNDAIVDQPMRAFRVRIWPLDLRSQR
jgi:hypothetical protein